MGRITAAEAQALELRPVAPGIQLGPAWATWWFRVRATVPEAWEGRRVDLLWDSRSEATLWVDGVSRQGLNAGPHARSGPMATLPQDRTDAPLRERARAGERLEAWVEVACGTAFGQEGAIPLRTVGPALLERCELAAFDADAWELAHDFAVLQALEAHLDGDLEATWRGRLLHELNRFCTTGDRAILRELLATPNAAVVHELSAVGHGHIDTAWLWPVAETHRKCVRTFSSATALMERYPEFRFACSQAQQYAWVKARNPELYARIRERARAGQWVPVGGTWVEPDCNLPSGESLVRQFLHGQRFFEAEFGARCREFWNPDVFGYNGQLPQIMRGAGIRRFLTQKLSWNAFTKPPYHTFRWAGIDGSEVLAHFPPADTYNAEVTVAELRFNARNYKDHDRSAHSLMLFGHGDGGGGPTPAMLERLRRANDLEGLPRTVQRTPEAFFDAPGG